MRAEVVPDDVEDISSTLQDLRRRVANSGVVFTSGGIGPTHDDVTYDGVARAFGEASFGFQGTEALCPSAVKRMVPAIDVGLPTLQTWRCRDMNQL